MNSVTPDAERPRSRLDIEYTCAVDNDERGAILPLVIVVLSDLGRGADLPPLNKRRVHEIDYERFDQILKHYKPQVAFQVPDLRSGGHLSIELEVESLEDFGPDAVARRVEPLKGLIELRNRLAEVRHRLHGRVPLARLLTMWLSDSTASVPAAPEPAAAPVTQTVADPAEIPWELAERLGDNRAQLLAAVRQVFVYPPDPDHLASWLTYRIADYDSEISAQVLRVLHHPDFRRLEAAWLSLRFMVDRLEPCRPRVLCRYLSVTRDELVRDMDRDDLTQSVILEKLGDEFNWNGGNPVSVIVGDYEFDHADARLLEALGCVAETLHAVFIASAAPELLNLESFALELSRPRSIEPIFDSVKHERWRDLRKCQYARSVALTMPRMLLRAPYLLQDADGHLFNFEEPATEHPNDYLWGHAAFALAERIGAAWQRTGWFDDFLGVEGGIVDALPVHTFQAAEGDVLTFCPTEAPDRGAAGAGTGPSGPGASCPLPRYRLCGVP